MVSKNYYSILELSPSASYDEVRKAFRRLAVKYHPDKNPDDPDAEAAFKEVQEAYSVLSHPEQRSQYDQRRWYHDRTRPAAREEVLSAQLMRQRLRELGIHMKALEPSFVNTDALFQYVMKYLLNKKGLQILEEESGEFSSSIIAQLLAIIHRLPYSQVQEVTGKLLALPALDEASAHLIRKFLREQQWQSYWKKYQAVIVLALTLVICWLIYMSSR